MCTNYKKTVSYNFKYIKSLYIIDIKSGLDCQFDSFIKLYKQLY
jgi:hypothetical protein